MRNVLHTPGPWIAEPDGVNDWKVRSEDYGTVVHRNCYPAPTVDTTVEADARLIAAAPELLEALQRILAIHCPLAGTPSNKSLVAFWEHEQSEGRGEAGDQLFALSAIAKALGNA